MTLQFSPLLVGQKRACFAAALLWLLGGGITEAQTVHLVPDRPLIARLPRQEGPAEDPQPDEVVPTPLELLPDPLPEAEMVGGPYLVPGWLQSASVERANASCEGQRLLDGFGSWVQEYERRQPPPAVARLPHAFRPWWDARVREPTSPALRVSIDPLIEGALQYSSYVQVVSTEPRIRRTTVVEEQAEFDWRLFLDATYTDLDEPVGNELTTGTNAERYKDRTWSTNGGVRRENRLGGHVELYQRLGSEVSNSRFLLPNPQATSRLELRYTQPLLNGAGCAYNESRIVLAQIFANASSDDLIEKLQNHLNRVSEAYWELYRARAEYFQRLKLVTSAEETLAILQGREGLDAVQRQILRARAAVATRQSEIARAHTSIRNAESQLRLLVNDPALVYAAGREFAPQEAPLSEQLPLAMQQSLYTALQHRPDISQAIREVRASAVRLGAAQQEILPKLDFVTSTYVAGLASQTHVAGSFGNQFDAGRPTFSLGFLFEVPLGRRAALAKEERRQWEMQRAFSQFRLTVEEALTAVELALREVETNYREMVGKYHAMVAVTDEADYLFDRWKALPDADDSAVLLLENLLDAQQRVADEEAALVRSMVSYAMSIVRLKQEMGTLLIITPLQDDVVAVHGRP